MPKTSKTKSPTSKTDDSVSIIPGIGPYKTTQLKTLGINQIKDLLYYLPNKYRDTSEIITIEKLLLSKEGTVQVTIDKVSSAYTRNRKSIIKAKVSDETGQANVIWFNQPFMKRVLKVDSQYLMTLKLPQKPNAKDFYCKDLERLPENTSEKETKHLGRIAPIYSQTTGITTKWLRGRIEWLLKSNPKLLPELRKNLPKTMLNIDKAIYEIHFPTNAETLIKAKNRFALEEMIELAYTLHERKKHTNPGKASKLNLKPEIYNSFIKALPFTPTQDQFNSIVEISKDLHSTTPMHRLINGDVGAGKTLVATVAALMALQSGHNVILLVPTTILAQQHYNSFTKLLNPFKKTQSKKNKHFKYFDIQLLTAKQKDLKLDAKKTHLIISTHAILYQQQIPNLALIIVDEQHRFGVGQREQLLSNLNNAPHYLHMTATPIPRTLTNILYEEEAISEIRQKPKHQKPITTKLVSSTKREKLYKWLSDKIIDANKNNKPEQAFIILPLVEETDGKLMSINKHNKILQNKYFKDLKVEAIHGQLKENEKIEIMNRFKNGDINILIATTVVEVGIDIPNATTMIIENAERYGLAQLHQLRGRVGRGEIESNCFVIPSDEIDPDSDSIKRLKYFTQHNSGFDLAEFDLKTRGPGEVYGLKQSGIPAMKVADIFDIDLLKQAKKIIQKDNYKKPPYNLLDLY